MSILPSEESVLSATARVFSFTAGISSEDSVSLSIVSESCNARVSSSKASALSIARVFLFHRKNFVWINCIFDHSGWLINARVSSSKANALSIARLFFYCENLVVRRKCLVVVNHVTLLSPLESRPSKKVSRCPHSNSRRTMRKTLQKNRVSPGTRR